MDGVTAGFIGGPGEAADTESVAGVSALFRAHHLELVRLALVMVGDLAAAEDVVQDVFERLHRRWHRLRNRDSALAYARSAVLNGCAAVARRHLAALQAGAGPPDAAQAAADRSELAVALRALPHRQREVLVLRYYLDLDIAEIAATLRINPSTVRSTSARGLAALASALREGER